MEFRRGNVMALSDVVSAIALLAVLATLASAPPVRVPRDCGDQKFYQQDTNTCEPCGILCDPPGVYVTECPKRCPRYTPTTTTTLPPVPGAPPPDPGWFSSYKSVIIVVGILVGVIATIALIVYAVVKRKTAPWRRCVRCFGREETERYPIEESSSDASSDTVPSTDRPLLGGTQVIPPSN